jgi:S-DNA-T family DNA segregation ATPase FtsK/SpoIIIE
VTADASHDRQPGGELIRFPGGRHDDLELGDANQPARQDDSDGKVFDAELVEEPPAPKTAVARAVAPIRVVATRVTNHQPTVRTSKALVRHTVYVLAGFGIVVNRWWDRRTGGLYERQIMAAEAAGDLDRVADWEHRRAQAQERRHRRRLDLVKLPRQLGPALLVLVVGVPVLLVLAGLAVAINEGDLSLVFTPLSATMSAVGWLVAAVMWLVTWLAFLAPVLAVGLLWMVGRRASLGPSWLRAPAKAGDQMDQLPDEGTIVKAIHNLNIKGFNDALKGGWRVQFLMPPVIDGKGWRTQISLPPACTVEDIVRKKATLAHNLVRFPIEVWPTEPSPAVLDLWVAKSGALSGPVDPWPLLKDLGNARADYFKGVPVGVTIKGDVVKGRLSEANYVIGGMMGSGKSTLVITMLLGAILDPLVDVDVVVMAENADYEALAPRLRSLATGAGEETVEHCLSLLMSLYEELSLRGAALREHDERAVTRELSEKDHRLRPRIVVIDECQNLFIGEHGKAAIEVATKLMSTARKYAITLMFLTPEPSKDALPRKLISVASNKACFAIGDHQANDAVLGSGSYKAGISAVGLTPKTDEGPGDVGTCMARGFLARPGLMRCFYIPQADAHRVAMRAMQIRSGRGRVISAPAVTERDLLSDVAEVLGAEPRPAADVPALLARAFPAWSPYQRMTGKELVQLLGEEGVTVPSTGNRWPVRPAAVREVLSQRAS